MGSLPGVWGFRVCKSARRLSCVSRCRSGLLRRELRCITPGVEGTRDVFVCRQYASCVTLIREHPSTDSCHRSCDLYIHYQVPIQWLWVDHPADELVQLTTSYTSAVKNMISQFIRSISSSSRTDKTEGGHVK